jgi:hypothetical protein
MLQAELVNYQKQQFQLVLTALPGRPIPTQTEVMKVLEESLEPYISIQVGNYHA